MPLELSLPDDLTLRPLSMVAAWRIPARLDSEADLVVGDGTISAEANFALCSLGFVSRAAMASACMRSNCTEELRGWNKQAISLKVDNTNSVSGGPSSGPIAATQAFSIWLRVGKTKIASKMIGTAQASKPNRPWSVCRKLRSSMLPGLNNIAATLTWLPTLLPLGSTCGASFSIAIAGAMYLTSKKAEDADSTCCMSVMTQTFVQLCLSGSNVTDLISGAAMA
mmetsp:Transcript_74217/g.176807  ORF Transcript_74217/g.176807 Transcript_74217/m.176807 type:complete len:224 (-) Transcript_74217:2956-3627(-)